MTQNSFQKMRKSLRTLLLQLHRAYPNNEAWPKELKIAADSARIVLDDIIKQRSKVSLEALAKFQQECTEYVKEVRERI